eukprot:GHVH01000264.1.p1 GENE.GHVH01000264.1~~GHVH01000264.1.p1  ORF type:complete len:395 (+),score=34.91 GHVH01000264.1:207-1391(+)
MMQNSQQLVYQAPNLYPYRPCIPPQQYQPHLPLGNTTFGPGLSQLTTNSNSIAGNIMYNAAHLNSMHPMMNLYHYPNSEPILPPSNTQQWKTQASNDNLLFTAEDLMLTINRLHRAPECAHELETLITDIKDGRKGRHDLLHYVRSYDHEVDTPQLAAAQVDTTTAINFKVPQSESMASEEIVSDSSVHLDEPTTQSEGHDLMPSSRSSSNTGIRGITWQESRNSYQASVCISLKQIYKIFSSKRVGKERALSQACKWLQEMRTRRDNGEDLESLMKAGLLARKVSNTGIRGITWQESRMKFQCSIYMEKGRRVQKYFPTGLNRSGPRYEDAFRKAQQWTKMMDQKKNQLTKQKYCVNAPAPQTSQPIDPLVSRGTLSYDNVPLDTSGSIGWDV